jgi:histidine ammonia-lyase
MKLLAYELLTTTYWMDVRRVQDPTRSFGQAATGAWTAFRKILPWQQDPRQRPQIPYGIVAYDFLKSTPATTFFPSSLAMPDTGGHAAQSDSAGQSLQ